ncbi:efflux RND transporter periplasmic adaptor subunit [Hymenobacter profundi]|uniref:Efflux RND transporter periplasmic adaptor subunit n=1 Tax=Hymenobacter profundi TaxID=1982110 RepID=A0ABS6X134_9BACT|nr:efflux RND transporter periplasmic adaptor subunit [Hymenobacter profundi]MBW3129541.1 efflux RND transporter periplasmic adaptor subunit [Hymenobacter profundi]
MSRIKRVWGRGVGSARLLLLLFAWFVTASCNSTPAETKEASEAAAVEKPTSPNQLTLSPTQAQAAGIEIGTFDHQEMTTDVLANGLIDVPPQNMASISAVMGGYVQTVNVLPGQFIKRGGTVAVLRHPDYLQLQQNYLQSRARLRFLQQELDRQQVLDAEDVGAKRKLQQAQADYQTEQAALRALAAQVRMLGLSVARLDGGHIAPTVPLTAPVGGFVRAVNINPGQYVGPQDVLVEVVDRSDLHLELKVFEKDIARVKVGQRILFNVPNSSSPDNMTARIFLVGKAFDDNDRTVSVHAHLEPERDDLLPGQYVSARIQTGGRRQRTLPEDAIIQDGEVSYAFVRTATDSAGSTFRRLRLRASQPQHGAVAVTLLDKLPDTTQLVRRGAYFLQAELTKGQGDDE